MNAVKQLQALDELARFVVDTYPYYQPWRTQTVSFADLPILDKHTINEHRAQLERPGLGKVHESFTSGSTGIPFRCIKTPEEQTKLTMAIYKHRRKWGLPLKYQMLLLSNRFLAEPSLLAHYTKQIRTMKPQLIQGRLSQLYELAKYMKQQDLTLPPEVLFLQNWGEPIQPGPRQFVEATFGIPVVDYYGMEEIWCIAFSNRKGELEVDEQLVYLEIVDPKTGERMPDEEYGEVLVTSWVMKSLPFVRYRTGDIGRMQRDQETGKLILQLLPVRYSQIELQGRTSQVAIFRYLDRFFYELHQQHGVKQFQIVQETHTLFRLLIVGSEIGSMSDVQGKLQALLTQYLGVDVRLVIEKVAAIAPNPVTGKYQSFVSQVR